ncbi:hypothetical protein [Kytococcus sedentarius]|uniref:hypothetical protein n=1 Tax=Kytococcus sedentarius TaxID=1276 RepID=UPI0035BBF46E
MPSFTPPGTPSPTRALGTLLLALLPGFIALVINIITMAVAVVAMLQEDMDAPWTMWSLLGGILALVNMMSVYKVVGRVARVMPASRPVVLMMFLTVLVGVAVTAGIAAALVARIEPPPASLGDAWLTPTLLIFAAAAWIAAWAVPVAFIGRVRTVPAQLGAFVLIVLVCAGVIGPMVLTDHGASWMVKLALLTPLVTLPMAIGLLLTIPLQLFALPEDDD